MAPDIPFLGTYFDEIVETEADNECRAWVRKMLGAKAELGAFVASRRLPPVRRGTEDETGTETGTGAGTGTYVAFLKGSFNLGFRYSFPEGSDTIIRFPKPGHTATALRDEKVVNEVRVLEYLRQNTTIPLPRVHSWGLTAEGPLGLGPFIIMDFVEGTLLTDVLKRPTANEQERHILNPDVDNAMLDNVYRQIAG
ncbi:uncharacterized protein DNG_08019 [Cephalotrichum gorgonifer]|uniref:Aminoglycoside phosphotransferase domain-containing protein n=1 Tax=Cephalotrichum gorgonifer TaxID=2041049 RepID=A0AAE8N3K0_9PEZI|nr:uncharacterized protein DNG_08019 [Cephalotrichum gorgonifer]